MKKKVLITGSSGFIGTYFKSNVKEFDMVNVNLISQKIDDIEFSGVDSVLHLAALVHQMKGAPKEDYYRINRDLTFNLAKKAKEKGVKHFVFMSTVKVYGEHTKENESWNEASACFPKDDYGKSKLEAENLLRSIEDKNFKVAIVRSPLVYGEGVKANMLKLIRLTERLSFLPLGGIRNKRSMVYLGNLVAILKLIIQKQSLGIFLAADSLALSTSQFIRTIAHELGKTIFLIKIPGIVISIIHRIKPGIYNRIYASLDIDSSVTNKSLNHEPPFKSEEGFNKMVKWYKKTKNTNTKSFLSKLR